MMDIRDDNEVTERKHQKYMVEGEGFSYSTDSLARATQVYQENPGSEIYVKMTPFKKGDGEPICTCQSWALVMMPDDLGPTHEETCPLYIRR